jgi:hypothetical protein
VSAFPVTKAHSEKEIKREHSFIWPQNLIDYNPNPKMTSFLGPKRHFILFFMPKHFLSIV